MQRIAAYQAPPGRQTQGVAARVTTVEAAASSQGRQHLFPNQPDLLRVARNTRDVTASSGLDRERVDERDERVRESRGRVGPAEVGHPLARLAGENDAIGEL